MKLGTGVVPGIGVLLGIGVSVGDTGVFVAGGAFTVKEPLFVECDTPEPLGSVIAVLLKLSVNVPGEADERMLN